MPCSEMDSLDHNCCAHIRIPVMYMHGNMNNITAAEKECLQFTKHLALLFTLFSDIFFLLKEVETF